MKFIDLFCGCGGLSKGFTEAGHTCLLGVDNNKSALQTFAANNPNSNIHLGDIHELSKNKLLSLVKSKVDIILNGASCQGFSSIGHGSPNDVRNYLYKQSVRITNILKPKYFVFENVPGILAPKNNFIFSDIIRSFELLGYKTKVLNLSAENFGVPQKRQRVFILGYKSKNINDLYATHGKNLLPLRSVSETICPDYKLSYNGEILNHNLDSVEIKSEIDRKRLKFIPPGKGIRYKKDEDAYLPSSLKYDVNWRDLKEHRFRQKKLQRLPLNYVSPTILTSKKTYIHPIDCRYLTVRECAALQSFPNDFRFEGSVTSQYSQVGNAVPPVLSNKISECFSETLNENKNEN